MVRKMTREAVAVFREPRQLQQAVDELMLSGFDRSYLSLMATADTVERTLGDAYRRITDIADHPQAPHEAFVGTDSRSTGQGAAAAGLAYVGAVAAAGAVVASGGALAAAIVAAVAAGGAGGALGVLLGRLLDAPFADGLLAQMERGGILLWVRTVDAVAEEKACRILARCGGAEVHVHEFAAPEPATAGGQSAHFAWVDKPIADLLRRGELRSEVAVMRPRQSAPSAADGGKEPVEID